MIPANVNVDGWHGNMHLGNALTRSLELQAGLGGCSTIESSSKCADARALLLVHWMQLE